MIDKDVLKRNAIRIADCHKATCHDAGCNVSLYALAELLIVAGISLSEEERKIFGDS